MGGTSTTGGSKAIGGGNTSGGTSANGGTSAAGGSKTTGGTSSNCNVTPVTPKASQQAKNLLCYLYSIYGKNVLSGQQETSWSNPENDISWYATNGMKYPAILGGDYLYPSGTTTRAIAYWKSGGITMIRYHMGAPPTSDTYENSKGSTNIANVLTANTAENKSFVSKLDYVATELKKLEDANVPVLWAPFHEYQPNGWFWWSKGTAAQFVDLWKYMFNYLTNTKGLTNLVWLAPSSGTIDASWYPGKAYLDIAGPDTYETNQPFTTMFTNAKKVIGNDVPIALHETGLVPTPSAMFPTAAPWVLFNIWAGYQSDGTHNTTANVKTTYESPYTITRDELPNLN
jgi:beta-mannanase